MRRSTQDVGHGIVANEGAVEDVVVLTAAALHDTIEDTETTASELVAAFGAEIAGVVVEVTDNKALSKQARKQAQIDHAADLGHRAKLVKLADKICNVRDVASSPPANWPLERRQDYFDWAKRVVDRMRGAHPELEQLFDKAYGLRPSVLRSAWVATFPIYATRSRCARKAIEQRRWMSCTR
jgi:guanosine-3',5'-bis(diphosphate) 3'-pyrophosphohydrolase